MQMTTDQLDFLHKRGLPWHADEAMALRFADALDESAKAMFEAIGPLQLSATSISLSGGLRVDRDAGIIRGVCVIQAGMTRPSGGGHGSFVVDGTTCRQVADAINAKSKGVKVRASHAEIEGVDEILVRVGYLTNARVSGSSVVADFQAFDPNNSHVRTILGIAEHDPGSAGMSIVSTHNQLEQVGQNMVLRVHDVDAVDFVGSPAAAHTGMLAASTSSNGNTAMFTVTGTGADRAYRDVSDALLVKMGTPIACFDAQGHVVLDAFGRPQLRTPSREAVSLAAGKLGDVAEFYLRSSGSDALCRALSPMARPAVVNFAMNRVELARYFSHLSPMRYVPASVALSGASAGDFPGLMADTLNKGVLTHYAVSRRSWRAWAKRGTVDDFKQASRVRIEDAPSLQGLAEGLSIEFGRLREADTETFALGTYARGLRFTRQAMLNDDAKGLGEISRILGDAAGRLEDSLAYALLAANPTTADGNAFFSAGHGNTTTGALSVISLAAARSKLAETTNTDGDVLDLQGAVLLIPTSSSATGEQLLSSLVSVSPHEVEQPIKTVTTGHLAADSTTQWYLGTDPRVMAAVKMSFLTGAEQPQIDDKVDFDTDGMKFSVTHDVSAAVVDPRLMIRSSGE